MIKPPFDTDEVLKTMASECVKQGENLRAGVRELTLKALQTRELSLGQIKQVVGSVTQGVNLGAVGPGINTEKALADALAGMDDALLKAAQASQIALQQLGRAGEDFEHSQMKKALDDLERMEDEFLGTVKQASEGELKGVLEYNTAPLVSVDFNHNPASSIFDSTLTKVAEGTLVKVGAWYDNEWGFSNRMLDTAVAFMNAK